MRQTNSHKLRTALRIIQWASVFIAAILLSACGWHLRGTIALPSNIESVYIDNRARDTGLANDLSDLLRSNGATLSQSASTADMVISLLEFEQKRRINGLSSNTLVNEYELINEAEFEIKTASGLTLLEPTLSSLSRSYRYDQNAVVSAAAEEELINDELRLELAQQIIRRLQFLDTETGTP